MWDSKYFKAGVGILLVFLIIYIGKEINFIFRPFVIAIEALFVSFLISGILYYFSYPLSDWLIRRKIPRPLAIMAVFLVIVGILTLLTLAVGPILAYEFSKLAANIPGNIKDLQNLIESLRSNPFFANLIDFDSLNISALAERLSTMAAGTITQIASSLSTLAEILTGFFTTMLIVPFLLYYMLKESGQGLIPGFVERFAPDRYQVNVKIALAEMNKMLGTYFQGVGIVCLCVGILAYIGFLIIGLEYALILAIIILVTNVVPYIGPFIGAIPAALIGLIDSPLMMFKVIVVIVIVQQIESLFISPQVMGRKMALSPLAIILIILIAGRLAGLLGIILAVPTFTVLKIIANHTYEYVRLNKTAD